MLTYLRFWENAKNRYTCSHWAKIRYILKKSKKRTPRAVFLAHEKALFFFFLRLSSSIKNLQWVTVFEFLYGSLIYICFFWLFSWSDSLYSCTKCYCCIVAIYDVRSSHIVTIRTGLKSRLTWDWSAVIHSISARTSSLCVKWKETSYV